MRSEVSSAPALGQVGAWGARSVSEPSRRAMWGPVTAALIALSWAATPVAGFRASLLILTLMGFAAIFIGLRYPVMGILGITILCILDSPSRVYLLTGGLLRWNTFNYCLLLVMLLYLPALLRLRDPHSLTLIAFVALLMVEVVISPDIGEGVQNILGIIITFGLLIYFVRAGYDRDTWFWLAINGGLMGALGGLMFFLDRINLPTINENAWAALPLTALFAILLGFPSAAEMKRGQPTLLALAAANIAWIFLSGSRGTLAIGTCCLLGIVVGMRGVRQRTMALAAGAIIVLVAAAHFGKLQERAIHRLTKLFTPEHALVGNYSLGSRTSGRSDLAIGGWYIFEAHPFGVGTGGFPHAWSQLGRHYGLVYGRGQEKSAHSGWVKTLVENGAPGLILLLVYVFSFAAVGLRQRSWALWRLGMLTSAMLAASLISNEFQSKGVWFLAAGATAFLQRERLAAALYGTSSAARGPARSPADALSRLEEP